MGAVGVGTGVGAAACCALGSVAGLASVFMGILPFPNSLAGCPVLLAGTGAGWLMGGRAPMLSSLTSAVLRPPWLLRPPRPLLLQCIDQILEWMTCMTVGEQARRKARSLNLSGRPRRARERRTWMSIAEGRRREGWATVPPLASGYFRGPLVKAPV